jgi:Cu2+-exporting ATPase
MREPAAVKEQVEGDERAAARAGGEVSVGPRSDDAACAHCGLPVPPALIDPAAEQQFCCHGCRSVHAVLRGHGLGRFYQLAEPDQRQPARVTGRSYEELDDPGFQQRACETRPDGLLSTELYLEGIHCTACVWLVEAAPRLAPGLVEARLDLGRSLARVSWRPDQIALSRVARLLDSLGYPVHPYRSIDLQQMRRREDRQLLMRIGVAAAVAGNVMLIAIALYAGMFSGIEPSYERFFRWISLTISIPAVFWSGGVFFRGALAALRARTLHMDLPLTIGILAGFGWGAVNTVRGAGEVYFDSLTVLIFLLLVGRWLQRRQQRRAADATELLYSLTPRRARLVQGAVQGDGAATEGVREVPVEAVLPGATVEVRAGESIPVDGRVIDGSSTINAALLTGESRPARVAVGDRVHAGTLNVGARLRVEVTATGEQTRVGQLMAQVEQHARRRAPIVQLADRIAGAFVAVVLLLATVTALIWLELDPSQALDNAIALLIVTCPCALGLATPLAVAVGIGRAARRGILIKGGDALERLAHPSSMLLDKTGTVTEGRVALVGWHGDPSVEPAVAALEQHSAHPLARAAVEALPATDAVAEQVRELPGAGIEGTIGGVRYQVGSPAWVGAAVDQTPAWVEAQIARWVAEHQTPVLVAREGQVVAAAAFGDPVRADARAALDRLRAQGWQLALLSGDHPRLVATVARALGLSEQRSEGGATPERKLARVEQELARAPVVMVGDGVNDAAALAAATAGVAMHGGAEASLAVADVYIGTPGLAPLCELVEGARSTLRLIRRNLLVSLAYNVVGAALAITGVITPLIAAVLMPLSSLSVVLSSYRSRTFG